MTAHDEMARFGFCSDQQPHPIFEQLSKLRNTQPKSERHSRQLDREISIIEARIEQSMDDAQTAQAAREEENQRTFWAARVG